MHHIFACLFVCLNSVIPNMGLTVLQSNERDGSSLWSILVLFFLLISHLQLTEVSFENQGLLCQHKVSVKYDICPLTF